MSLQELECAVSNLDAEESKAFREWFAEYDAAQWDRQIEEDSRTGRFDAMIDEALKDHHTGRSTDLHP